MWFPKRDTTLPAPFAVAPTGEFDGSDGNWSTFKLDVGTPPQSFRVSVSSIGNAIWLPQAPGACDNQPSNCPDFRGIELFNSGRSEGYNTNKSTDSTYTFQGLYDIVLNPDLERGNMQDVYGSNYNVSAAYGQDTVSLDSALSGGSSLSQDNLAIAGYNEIYDFTIGSLGLGLGDLSLGQDSIPTLMTALYNASKIPSLSWSYTAGAIYKNNGYEGSLVLGGYDSARFTPSNATFQLPPSTQTSLLQVSVKSFAINYKDGTRYTPTVGSDSSTDVFNATLDSTLPYLYFPSDVVDALVDRLNLNYDRTNDIYLTRGDLDNDIDEFEFTLTDTIEGTNTTSITLPRDAFALTASYPLYNTSTSYFPIRKANNNINIIGRVFFQEAYVTADYGRGNFSISQAKFTTPQPQPQLVAISNGTTTDHKGSSGLSGGAIAGIVIGVLAGVALLAAGLVFLWLRKRREQRAHDQAAAFAAAEEEKRRQEALKERRETISTMLSQDTAVSYEMDARGVIASRPMHMRHISELSSDSENERVRKIVNSPDTVFELPDSSAWESNEARMAHSPHAPSPMLSATEGTVSEAPDNQSESAGIVSPASPTPSQRVVSGGGIDRLAAPSEENTHSTHGER